MMKNIKRNSVKKTILKIGALVIYTTILGFYHVNTINKIDSKHEGEIIKLKSQITDNKAYKMLYEDNNEKLMKLESEYNETKNKLSFIESQVVLSRQIDTQYNRTNFANKELNKYPIMTIDEMNEWISDRAPENSTFIGKGKEFLEVSKEVDLDPRYLVAHAALESSWGTSKIAKEKNNFYGIGAYNSSPYESAKSFPSTKSGILEGAKWIKANYIEQGQDTLNKMQFGKKTYCTLDDGVTPDSSWITKIVAIIY